MSIEKVNYAKSGFRARIIINSNPTSNFDDDFNSKNVNIKCEGMVMVYDSIGSFQVFIPEKVFESSAPGAAEHDRFSLNND